MDSVKIQITPGSEVSRVEVLIRMILIYVYGIIACLFGIVAGILVTVNFFTCLILAKRVGADFLAKYLAWITKVSVYLYFVTDERPPWTP